MFSDSFRERLRLGKYSRWAVDLTEAQLEAVLWMVGEYGYRAYHVLPHLADERAPTKGRVAPSWPWSRYSGQWVETARTWRRSRSESVPSSPRCAGNDRLREVLPHY